MDNQTRRQVAASLRAAAAKLTAADATLLRKGVKEQHFKEAVSKLHEVQERYFPNGSLNLGQDNYGQYYITIYTNVKDEESGRKYEMKSEDFDETDEDFEYGSRKTPIREIKIEDLIE